MQSKNPKILVVDDELELLELFRIKLNKAGFDVNLAGGGKEAINEIVNESFDAIVCDINMPGNLNGFGVLDYIRNNVAQKIPFIFVTGHGEGTPEMDQAINSNVEGVFSKPVNTKQIVELLHNLCDKK